MLWKSGIYINQNHRADSQLQRILALDLKRL
jgi:hypothetical protein